MKTKNILSYIIGGFIGLLVVGFIGVLVYHKSYARKSYDIAECTKKYQFVDMTVPREVKLSTAAFVNPKLYQFTTMLFIYPARELQEKGLLDTLYSEATDDPEVFLRYGRKNNDDAIVLLKTILSQKTGEEPIYCVMGKEQINVNDLLNDQDIFSMGVQWKRAKRGLPPEERAKVVISWGAS